MQQHSSGDTERSGKRKSIGKRKLSDQGEPSQPQSQRTISDVLSKKRSQDNLPPLASSTSKRSRYSHSPTRSSSAHPVSPTKMYNFSGSPPKNGAAFGRSAPALNPPSVKSQALNVNARQNNFSPHAGAKKLVVKNLRTGPRVTQEPYFDKTWAQLNAALSAIFDGRKPDVSLEELYKGAENICRQERAALLAKKVQERCKDYVAGTLRDNLVTRAGGGTNVDTLRAVIEAWSAWHSRLVTIRWVFYYLDQSFLLHSKEFPVIQEMGLIQFRSYIFADRSLKPKVLQGACDLITADRVVEGCGIPDPALLRASVDLFHNLDVYNSDFEPLFINETERFVASWAQREVAGYLASYVENSHGLIERELERCALFSLNQSTKQKLSELLDRVLISEQEDALLAKSDVLGLMRSSNKSALKQLYTLLNRKGLTNKLKPAFNSFIVEEGSSIVFDEANEPEMVVRLLQFKQELDATWASAFNRDDDLSHALREAFAQFMNLGKKTESTGGTDNPKTGEMIAKHVDRLLKGGLKATGAAGQEDVTMADEDAEINRQLDQVLDLFRFVQGKAVFEAFYKNDLARRLLMGKSANDDAEKSMLVRLKKECGSSFTHNLESMFKDMDVARDEMRAYNEDKSARGRSSVDLNVSVISASAWPSYPDVQVTIPRVVASAISDFENFYHKKHTGRKLQWKHQLAHCQLRARFPKEAVPKDLVVSSFQAIVLLLFNDVAEGESLSYADLQKATGLSDPELKRTLQSLACAKYRVLTKNPKGKEVSTTDQFSWNAGFTDFKRRIKINQIQLKETKEENKTTHERVAADRHYETQAAIVRIMKSRKTIKHAELMAEVIEATRHRGTLQPAEIKTNIEKLIEKDYMERAEGNQYSYVA
ncbi:uncharacterized protein N7498_000847 [Penicillium cinerascens]|uniref:Cullin family profile domain-containing protein n=1 Tax=Penicillium cinerascens TaxID=70096 RepID=A0A9W9TDH5_9EURO|nr:uncharacterized protein N7498_000847 [Penicillium cinerascens]KAJ5218748.1 hypothetical protein N7498_000847 [Penicillium cinerascens]